MERRDRMQENFVNDYVCKKVAGEIIFFRTIGLQIKIQDKEFF